MMRKKYLAFMLAVFMILGNSMIYKEEVFASTIVSQQIPNDAVEYNGNHYKVYTNIIGSNLKAGNAWTAAEQYCESLGGHLATISSEEENRFIFNYINSVGVSSAYFGLSDQEVEGTWKWVNGEEVNYTNWASGEPNAESSTEDYSMFYYKFTTGKWNDGNFGGSTVNGDRNFICEWESVVDLDISSGFTLGEDNNNYVHTNNSSWNGAGFIGSKDYSLSNEYFNKLTKSSSKSEKNKIKKQ